MTRTRSKTWQLFVAGALSAGVLVGWGSRAEAVLCFADAKSDGTGKPMRWAKMPIPYYINATKVAAADKAAWIKAVQDAFKTYEQVPCASLTFDYKGESTSVDYVDNAILVNFSDVVTGSYYLTRGAIKTYEPPDIFYASIQMNIKEANGYGIGAKPNMIDIQTAVTQMIPIAIGFYAGSGNPKPGFMDLPAINFNVVTTTLTAEQIQGVQATYPKAGCTPPTISLACAKATPPAGDAKPIGDGGPKPTTDGGPKPTTDGGPKPTTDGGPKPTVDRGPTPVSETGVPIGGDSSTLPPKDDDSGCCRVGHTGSDLDQGYLALCGLLVMGGLLIRRRRR